MAANRQSVLAYPAFRHGLFWVFAFLLLTLIYGTAYNSYSLGVTIILMLLPVHITYFYILSGWILPRFFSRGKYVQAIIAVLVVMICVACLYRLFEIFISNPYILHWYTKRNVKLNWPQMDETRWQQLLEPLDFANALERSNVVVWIGVTLKFISLWYERRQAATQAELNFLKSQLHPHFLFNSLNNLYAFALDNSPRTPEIILGLSNILRYMLYECNAEKVPLKKDLDILHDYIKLEQLRYEERLELNFNIKGDVNGQQIAPLLMLPLVENAFKHGAGETIGVPWINIDVLVNDRELTFKVSNSKPDCNTADSRRHFSKIGLSNVQKRLVLLYPARHRFNIYNEEELFITELKLELYEASKPVT